MVATLLSEIDCIYMCIRSVAATRLLFGYTASHYTWAKNKSIRQSQISTLNFSSASHFGVSSRYPAGAIVLSLLLVESQAMKKNVSIYSHAQAKTVLTIMRSKTCQC